MQDDSGLPPSRLGALIVEGYSAPRDSIAHVLRMHPDERARLLMVGIGVCVGALGLAMFGGPAPVEGEAPAGGQLLSYVVTAIAGILQYFFLAFVIGLICSFAGGKGRPEDNRTLVAWWLLVTSPLTVVMMLALSAQTPLAAFALIASVVLSFVMLAAYIAETHQFKSTARVCGVMLAMLIAFSFVLSSFVTMPVPA